MIKLVHSSTTVTKAKKSKAYKIKLFLETMKKTHACLALSCEAAGLKRWELTVLRTKMPGFDREIKELLEYEKDVLEHKLFCMAINGDFNAMQLWLTAKCPERGYGGANAAL